MTANLQNPIFTDETKAREWLEARVWPQGPICPHCGAMGDDVTCLKGNAHRPGLYQCSACREQFTVTVKTVFERSKIPLSKWLAALFLLTASKKGVSAHQVHRSLAISYKSAWFMMHRLREAMRQGGVLPPLGGNGQVIKSDESYWGPKDVDRRPAMKRRRRGKPGLGGKARIMTLVERGGSARPVHVTDLTNETTKGILLANADTKSRLVTDEGPSPGIGLSFAKHDTVKHSVDEYVRYVDEGGGTHFVVTTNTVEGFFGLFKRGMRGTYQRCKEKHLHRYLAEFDFRCSNRAALGVMI